MKHENQIRLAAALLGGPPLLLALVLLWRGELSSDAKWGITALLVLFWIWAISDLHRRVVYPLRTVSNMLSALRERDFSMRARRPRVDDPLGEVLLEVNSLADLLREQRLSAMETSALLRRIMSEIDVAVFTFDEEHRLRLVNGYAERLLGTNAGEAIGKSAEALGFAELLQGSTPRMLEMKFATRMGRWELRRGTFLESGSTRQLVLLSDLTRTLREEERQAWQRMVNVLRHEVNNSLAPISSVAESLGNLVDSPANSESAKDLREGLGIISDRSKSLTRFMMAYSQLTRLPPPNLRSFDVGDCVRRVAGLETRVAIRVKAADHLEIRADGDQIEQMLLNLVRNGAEAAMETRGGVAIGWELPADDPNQCEIWIEDDGPGISNPSNLFVPFYTTKPNGSGIGLALCRQIAEAHGGSVVLQDRKDERGCRAVCRLPISGN